LFLPQFIYLKLWHRPTVSGFAWKKWTLSKDIMDTTIQVIQSTPNQTSRVPDFGSPLIRQILSAAQRKLVRREFFARYRLHQPTPTPYPSPGECSAPSSPISVIAGSDLFDSPRKPRAKVVLPSTMFDPPRLTDDSSAYWYSEGYATIIKEHDMLEEQRLRKKISDAAIQFRADKRARAQQTAERNAAQRLKRFGRQLQRSLSDLYREGLAKERTRSRFAKPAVPKVPREPVKPSYLIGPPSQPRSPRAKSPNPPAASKRAVRENAQRVSAAEAKEAARKAVPKVVREKDVKSKRDKRSGYLRPDSPELQSGQLIELGAQAALAAAFVVLIQFIVAYVSGFTTTVNSTAANAKRATDKSNELLDALLTFKDKMVNLLGKTLWSVPTCVVLYYIWSRLSESQATLFGVVLASFAGMLAPGLWSEVSVFFRSGGVQQQSGFTTAVASKLLTTALCFAVFGEGGRNHIPEFMRRLALIERSSSGADSFINWTLDAFQVLVDYGSKIFGFKAFRLRTEKNAELLQWVKDVEKADLAAKNMTAPVCPERTMYYVQLCKTGYEFRDLYRHAEQSIERLVQRTLVTADNLLRPVSGALSSSGNFRMEPLMALLLGGSGVGKTCVSEMVCASVLSLSGILSDDSTANIRNNVWQKGTSDYWNGYAGQACLVMDDAFQSRANPADKDNDYINLIRAIGPWCFPLNMADLESKGKINLMAKFVFGTTNVACIQSEAEKVITSADAVARRIRYGFRMIVKEEFRTADGRLDNIKYLEAEAFARAHCMGIDRFPWHIWTLHPHDFLTGETTYAISTSLKRMVLDIAADLAARNKSHGIRRDYLDDFITNLKEEAAVPLVEDPPFVAAVLPGASNVRGLTNPPRALLDDEYVSLASPAVTYQSGIKWRKIAYSLYAPESVAVDFSVFERQDKEKCSMWFNAVLIIGSLFALREVLNLAFKGIVAVFNCFFPAAKAPKVVQQSNRVLTRAAKVNVKHVVLQNGVNNAIANNIYKNTYKLIIDVRNGCIPLGQITYITSSLAIQPAHFSRAVKEGLGDGSIVPTDKIRMINAVQQSKSMTFTVDYFLKARRLTHYESDVEFIELRAAIAPRNIISAFITESDVFNIAGESGRADVCEVGPDGGLVPDKLRKVHTFLDLEVVKKYTRDGFYMDRALLYRAATVKGDCGAPVTMTSNSSYGGRCLMGFHVAKDDLSVKTLGSIVTQEMVKNAIKYFDVAVDNFESDLASRLHQCGISVTPATQDVFSDMGSFESLYQVTKPVTICPATSFFKTPFYGAFGPFNRRPAHLNRVWDEYLEEWIYPMANAVEPYSSPVLIYEQDWLRPVAHVAFAPLAKAIRHRPRRILSFEEAIIGDPRLKFRSIPRATAPGFPYTYVVSGGKKEFFGEEADYDLTSPLCEELRTRVAYLIKSAEDNIRQSHVFVDFLKDELRAPHKIEAVATRLISSAPLDYTVVWRMYFGAFTSAVMRDHTVSGMAPGICTYTEWSDVVRMVSKHGPDVFAGDFKSFDSSEQPCIHELFLEFINDWYQDGVDNKRVRKVLWLDLIHSRHIGGLGKDQRHIYQWSKSLPSGHPFTTIVNSMYALFLMVAAYFKKVKKFDFWDHASSVVYGDDNVNNIEPALSELFNQTTVAEVLWDEFELEYTSDNKLGELITTTTIDKVTFLKRSFLLEDNWWLCPLELNSFLYTVYWCKNKKLQAKIALDVLETTLEELSLHPVEVWNEHAHKVYDVLLRLGASPRGRLERSNYLMIVKSRTDSWF
jgi:hypothetical protein